MGTRHAVRRETLVVAKFCVCTGLRQARRAVSERVRMRARFRYNAWSSCRRCNLSIKTFRCGCDHTRSRRLNLASPTYLSLGSRQACLSAAMSRAAGLDRCHRLRRHTTRPTVWNCSWVSLERLPRGRLDSEEGLTQTRMEIGERNAHGTDVWSRLKPQPT